MIFLDNASTTKMYDEVNAVMAHYNLEEYYNPSAVYGVSQNLTKKIDEEKNKLSNLLNVSSINIIFTSGATEGNNLIIKGLLNNNKKSEFVFSMGEHPSVYNVAQFLLNSGYKVHFVKLTKNGIVDFEDFKSKINEFTSFVSVIHVSNETGAINDIKKLSSYAKSISKNVIFHSDGVQAFGKIKVDLLNLGVDCYTISAHKFHGPKGTGFVYIKNLNILKPQIIGGGQQKNYRSGTENVAGILGMAKAAEMFNIDNNYEKVIEFRNHLKGELLKYDSNIVINEHTVNSPYILSFSVKGIKGEVLVHMLDKRGVLVSTGSACSTKNSGNRILQAMNRDKKDIEGNIRVSFSDLNTKPEIDEATKIIIEEIANLKAMIGIK